MPVMQCTNYMQLQFAVPQCLAEYGHRSGAILRD
ncbi:hypothetical protein A2U01_0065184, partial [Trifolium medium]|nr:hypothetical protein [Trifolium medium]